MLVALVRDEIKDLIDDDLWQLAHDEQERNRAQLQKLGLARKKGRQRAGGKS